MEDGRNARIATRITAAMTGLAIIDPANERTRTLRARPAARAATAAAVSHCRSRRWVITNRTRVSTIAWSIS
jgi:hypothetical protein